MYFSDSKNGWIAGGSGIKILRTTNGGESWFLQYQPLSSYEIDYFENVCMFDSKTGFIVGGSETILKTNNGGGLTGINSESPLVIKEPALYQNYPNPFNPATKIIYAVPKSAYITIRVFDILGREISTLVDEYKSAGKYEIAFDAHALAAGVYFYKMQGGNFVETKKLILLK